MSKTTISRLFVAAIMAVVAGVVVVLAGVLAAIADGAIEVGGTDVVRINGGALAWPLIGVLTGSAAIVGGAAAAVVSWLGALLNTARLHDKTWFVLLLVLGIVSLGWAAMILYVIAGPDGMSPETAALGAPTPVGS